MNKFTSTWLTSNLRVHIRKVFEPRYKRKLTSSEVEEIAENLTTVIEETMKLKWKQKYEYGKIQN